MSEKFSISCGHPVLTECWALIWAKTNAMRRPGVGGDAENVRNTFRGGSAYRLTFHSSLGARAIFRKTTIFDCTAFSAMESTHAVSCPKPIIVRRANRASRGFLFGFVAVRCNGQFAAHIHICCACVRLMAGGNSRIITDLAILWLGSAKILNIPDKTEIH